MENGNRIAAIIVDDDPFCSFQLQDVVTRNAKEIEIKAICNSAAEGLVKIKELAPDLVFLGC